MASESVTLQHFIDLLQAEQSKRIEGEKRLQRLSRSKDLLIKELSEQIRELTEQELQERSSKSQYRYIVEIWTFLVFFGRSGDLPSMISPLMISVNYRCKLLEILAMKMGAGTKRRRSEPSPANQISKEGVSES